MSAPKLEATSEKKAGSPRKRRSRKPIGEAPAPAGYVAKKGVTPARQPIRSPGTHKVDVLPFVDVGSVVFEQLCRDLVRLAFPDIVQRSALKPDRGQAQFGVDIEGFDRDENPAVVVSAKCYADVNAWDFKPWIEDFTRHLEGHWDGKGVQHFVLAVTHETNDDGMNAAAREAVTALRQRGIEFHLWNTVEMSLLMRGDAALVDRYFHRHWADALSATRRPVASSPALPGRRRASVAIRAESRVVERLEDGLDAALAAELNSVLDAVRAGRPSRLRDWIDRQRESDDTWRDIDDRIRARALRALARIEIGEERLDHAADLLDEADELSPAPD